MLRSIATISVNGALRTKLRAIADAGFEHVEIFESDLLASPEPVHVIGAMMRDQGLTCVAFQPFRDFEGMPAAMRERVFDRAERKFDVLEMLGTDLMLVSANVSPHALADRGRIVDDFRELGVRAAARGLRVAFEPLAWARHIRDHRDAWEIVRQVDHPAVGLALDTFSSLAPGIPIDSLKSILRKSYSMCRLPMHPSSPWIRCRGAAIFAACPGRATCLCSSTSVRCKASAMTACCHWRFSTIDFAQVRPLKSRWMACVPSTICSSRSGAHADCAHRLQGSRIHRVLRQRGRSPTTRPDAVHARFCQDSPTCPQGSDAVATG